MPPRSRIAWNRTLARLLLWLLACTVAGALVGHAWPGLATGALAALGWQYTQLRALMRRLTARRRLAPPQGGDVWNELERLIHRGQTEKRARKRRLIEMLRAYRAAAAALPDAIVIVDRASQRIQWFNQAGTALLGLTYPRDIGAPLAPRLHPLPIAHWLTAGRHAEPIEARSPVHPEATLSMRLIPYSDSLWMLVARDVTRLLRLEQMRRDFVANVSHELRTPLTVVHGYLDMIDPADNPELAPMLAEMQRQSQRMTQLVEDLLNLSRLESQDSLPGEETVAMAPVLAALGREAAALSQGRHEISVEDTALVDLWGAQRELHS
ncbi:MAG TPA: phosphate regulon sensor protein PhoR, partial [Lysobacter sp.]